MRGPRHEMMQMVDTLLDFGKVIASSIGEGVKNVLVSVTGAETQHGAERADNQPLYSHAGVLVRPAAPSDEGAFEVVYARVGDEMVCLASRDVRWQIELEEGEVVVRSMSDTPARIYLKPDGSVVVEAERIKLGKDASEAIAIASKVEGQLSRVKDAIQAGVAVPNDGGLNLQTTILQALNGVTPPGPAFPESTASEKVTAE
jgi:hypothetical protein